LFHVSSFPKPESKQLFSVTANTNLEEQQLSHRPFVADLADVVSELVKKSNQNSFSIDQLNVVCVCLLAVFFPLILVRFFKLGGAP
jgi:orotidine-5'-phosphate decarboxylase